MCLCLGYCLGEFLATEDIDQYVTLGAGNADIKQSDKGMAGPPMGGGAPGGEGEGGAGAPGGEGGAGAPGGEGGAPKA